jgi:hypothetical protein
MALQGIMAAGAGALSLVQLIQGIMQQKKAVGMFPQIPPAFKLLQAEYQRKSRNAEVGSMYQNTLNNARNISANASQAILQTGNPNAYNFAQRGVGTMLNELLGQVQNKSMAYDQLSGQMVNKIGDMQYGADANRYNTKMAQGIENQRFGMNNLMNLLTYNYGGEGGGGATAQGKENAISSLVGAPQDMASLNNSTGLPSAPAPDFRGTRYGNFARALNFGDPNDPSVYAPEPDKGYVNPTISSYLNL